MTKPSELREFNRIHYHYEHYLDIEQLEADRDSRQGVEFWEAVPRLGPCYTFWYLERVIFCAGVAFFWKGVGEAWFLGDKKMRYYPREVLWYSRESLREVWEQNSMHRIQATARCWCERHWRFLENMGFARESVLNGYGAKGEDFYMYARTKPWEHWRSSVA